MERRLAAILAADVVGYTRLMGADETGTLRRLTELRQQVLEPLIAEHYGRVVKLAGRRPHLKSDACFAFTPSLARGSVWEWGECA